MTYWEYLGEPLPEDGGEERVPVAVKTPRGAMVKDKDGKLVFKASAAKPTAKELREWSVEHKM